MKTMDQKLAPILSPPQMPIIGHMHLLRHYQHNPWEGFNAIRREWGDVVALKMGTKSMALVSSYEAMQEILLKKGDIFADRPDFARHHIIFGGDKENSLALCRWTNTHRDRRKLCKRGIVPCRFSARNQLLEEIVCQRTTQFVESLKTPTTFTSSTTDTTATPNSSSSSINTSSTSTSASTTPDLSYQEPITVLKKIDLLFLTSDVFMDFLCGDQYSHDSETYTKFAWGCDYVFCDINQMNLIDFLPISTSSGVGYSYLKRLRDETDFLRNFTDEEIFDPRLAKHEELSAEDPIYVGDIASGDDYLDSLILEYLSKTTSMSLADYKVGFADLLAGHAAVANMLIRVLGHLALNEKIQDLIREEAEKANLSNVNHKPSLPIAEAALLEALRSASSPIVPHVARTNTSIGEFFVPAGTMILFNIYHQNLTEDTWTNPYEFDPLRFIDNTGPEPKLNVPKHFMPFSVGMRHCLGKKMAETVSIVTIANLCENFIIRPSDENLVRELLTPKGSVALNPDAECFDLILSVRHNQIHEYYSHHLEEVLCVTFEGPSMKFQKLVATKIRALSEGETKTQMFDLPEHNLKEVCAS